MKQKSNTKHVYRWSIYKVDREFTARFDSFNGRRWVSSSKIRPKWTDWQTKKISVRSFPVLIRSPPNLVKFSSDLAGWHFL